MARRKKSSTTASVTSGSWKTVSADKVVSDEAWCKGGGNLSTCLDLWSWSGENATPSLEMVITSSKLESSGGWAPESRSTLRFDLSGLAIGTMMAAVLRTSARFASRASGVDGNSDEAGVGGPGDSSSESSMSSRTTGVTKTSTEGLPSAEPSVSRTVSAWPIQPNPASGSGYNALISVNNLLSFLRIVDTTACRFLWLLATRISEGLLDTESASHQPARDEAIIAFLTRLRCTILTFRNPAVP